MEFINNIEDPTIIICSHKNRLNILEYLNGINKLIPINFLSLKELYDSLYFSYDEKTLYNVMNKYNLKCEVAKEYLNSLIYMEDKSYNSKKLNQLVGMYNYLNGNNLLIKDNDFIKYIENKKVIIYGFDYIDNFMSKTINKLMDITNIEVINKDYNEYETKCYEFSHIEQEVEFIASKICDLICDGIDINKIKLVNVNDEYNNSIKRIFEMYNLPICLDKISLASTIIGKNFIDNYNSDLNVTIDYLSKNYNGEILEKIIDVINKYTFVDNKLLVKDLIINDLNQIYINTKQFEKYIDVINIEEAQEDDYVFFLEFNQDIPRVMKDEEFLENNDLIELNLNTTFELNSLIKESIINNIKSIKNLIITYKLESYTNSYLPSNLIDELGISVIKGENNYKYSNISNKIRLCKSMDKYYKYNTITDELIYLYSNYDIPYRKYDNRFKGVSFDNLLNVTKGNINLSYTSMQSYNECSFKYYINYILKLDTYEDTFSAFIGSLFHHILEIGIDKDINVKEEVKKYITIRNMNNKEIFYVEKLTSDIQLVLNNIKNSLKYTKFLNIETENKFEIIKNKKLNFRFLGFIDKKMSYEEDGKIYTALVDYKTYDADIKMELIDYGLNLQLPIYLYLVNNKYPNSLFAGFYIQNILSSELKYKTNELLIEQKKNSMKLKGYTISDESILKLFDSSYRDSEVIKGLKVKNDGNFYSTSNVLSSQEMNLLIEKIDEKVDECMTNIESCKFDINPKKYNNINLGCRYCKYKDICYRSSKDIIEIELEGGEVNDKLD